METGNGTASADGEALAALAAAAQLETPAPVLPSDDPAPPGVSESEAAQLDKVSKFLTGKIAKAANRFVPELFKDKDERELAELLAPVLTKHADRLGAWFEKWFEEIMLGVFVVDKLADAADLVKARRQQQPKPDETRAPA